MIRLAQNNVNSGGLMSLIYITAVFFVLSGCANYASNRQSEFKNFSGYIHIGDGFELYDSKYNYSIRNINHCISGGMKYSIMNQRNASLLKSKYEGKRVILFGTMKIWNPEIPVPGVFSSGDGSVYDDNHHSYNTCKRNFVIFADKIRLAASY